ncbi:bifunctional UDP-sugar hydrolase/5'-nucleotidase [Nitrosomonas sp. Nm33]|uniref:bifunctional metallophosphatase/5'-nucleotidase n=1 Tax=Nitrosomonas sp. Nm33 TaxID=133724 RepID=UPI00089BCD2D|nr:bifunctional metallophosphatase/5'-nucleotidase [Nitrosomonas sp. Nm33]SDZ01978.1 5'-nucleotidase [Nitrosomonas sp. Nm33]
MRLNWIAMGAALLLMVSAGTYAANAQTTTTIKILAFNDFHGQIESPGTFVTPEGARSNVAVGGVDWLAGYIAKSKAKNPATTVVSAGDLIGATPLVSALFHDEPTIETMSMAGLEFNALGNHEFDEGLDELKRMQKGGCHPTDLNSCRGAEVGAPTDDEGKFSGANFKFLAANVVETKSGQTIFPSFAIKTYKGDLKVGFIGLTLKETSTLVSPGGVVGLDFNDEAVAINALIPELRELGAEAIVILIHQGGIVLSNQDASTMNSCEGNLENTPLKPIVNALHDDVDLVISGHTHQAYNCMITNSIGRSIPVTSANSIGRILTDIDMTIDNRSGHVIKINAQNVLVDRNDTSVTPNAAIKAMVDGYKALSQPIANRVIGSITADIIRTPNTAGESALGDLIADAYLNVTKIPGFGEAVVAFVNPGSMRADLIFPSSNAKEGDGKITYGEAFLVQSFGNSLVTMTLTGSQIHTLLEQQFMGCTAGYLTGGSSGQPFNLFSSVDPIKTAANVVL